MKKIKSSLDKHKIKNKTINLSKILNSDFFFESSGNIKMALNRNRIVNKDFGIKKAKPKIDIGKKNKSLFISPLSKKINKTSKEEELNENAFFMKKRVPFELADILEENKEKFKKVYDSFYDIKSKNDIFISHWNCVQKSIQKMKNKENKLKDNGTQKDEYSKNLKNYDFSEHDKIELELEKKLTEKIFKSNPLMIKTNTDMLFYFLSMYKGKNINFKEQNTTKYLNKIKEILDYMEIYVDFKNSKSNADIKAQNAKFLMKRKKKIDEENMMLQEEQQKQNVIDNIESKRMIKQSKKTLKLINKNNKFFEDPKYFSNDFNITTSFFKNNRNKFLTPNKKFYFSKSSSNFFVGDKGHFSQNKNYNNTIKLLQEKRINLSKQLSSIMKEKSKKENKEVNNPNPEKNLKKYYSLQDCKNNEKYNSLFNNLFEENNSKKNSLRNSFRNKNNLKKVMRKSNSLKVDNLSNFKYLPSIKQFASIIAITPNKNGKNPNLSKLNNNIPQKNDLHSLTSENNNDNSRHSIKINNAVNENKKEIEEKNIISKKNKNVIISELYDKLKDGGKVNKNNLKHIYKYMHHKNKNHKKKKDTMNLIKNVQILSDGFDINKVTKSIENIPNKEIKQIKNFKKIGFELNRLDKRYVKEICEFKARNQRNDGQDEY